jgi:hypothetical protein
MELDDVEPEIFGMLIHWLYTKNIHQLLKDDKHNLESTIALTKLWILGQRFVIPAMQASVIVALQNKLLLPTVFDELTLWKYLANFIYKNTDVAIARSTFKHIVVRKFARSTGEVLAALRNEMPQEMWFDVSVEMAHLLGNCST